jgi:hypothetical protein
MHESVADRVEQQARDLAVPPGADDDELRPCRLVEQNVPGEPASDQALHGNVRVLLRPPGQPFAERPLALHVRGLPIQQPSEGS